MANYGFSFAPTAGNALRGSQAPSQRPQDAVSFRSLTLPRQDVPGRIARPSLTGAPGAIGTPPADLLRLLMQMLGGQGQRSMAAPVAPPSGAPQGLQPQGYAPQAAPVMQGPSMRPLSNTAPRVVFDHMVDRRKPPTVFIDAPQPPVFTKPESGPVLPPIYTPRGPLPDPGKEPPPIYTPPNYGGFDFAREFGSWMGF